MRAQNSKRTIASLLKMYSARAVFKCIEKGVLVHICSNSSSDCQVDPIKTVAISQIFNHVSGVLHVYWMH